MGRELFWVVFFVAVGVCPAHSATAQTLDDTGLWLATLGNGRFDSADEGSRLRWWFDAHYRLRDDTGGFNQSIIRPGLGYLLAEDQTIWAGYALIHTSPVSGSDSSEHRFWQQWTATPSIGEWQFQHRSRLEQRWRESGEEIGLRWRQFARGQRMLCHSPPFSLVLWDEMFLNLNDTDWGMKRGLDQNRAFIGFGYSRRRGTHTRTEIGYLNQFTNRQGGVDEMNHILAINLFF